MPAPAMSGCLQNHNAIRCNVYVPAHSPPPPRSSFLQAEYTQNPFASAHSLDTNPFDDPSPKQNPQLQDLDRRERDLERREQELNQRSEYIRKHGRSNWPPCQSSLFFPAPSSCPSVYPLIYHSISEEIPDASRPLITRLYQLWLVLLATLIINMVACIFILVAGASDGGKDLGGSIGYAFLFPSDHSLILRKLLVRNRSPLFSVVVQVRPSPLSISPPLTPHRPIYNGYMKVRICFSPPNTCLHVALSRNKLYITVRPIFVLPLLRVSPLARHVLLLWWISPTLQCLHVSTSTCPSPTCSVPSILRILGIPSTGSAGLIQTIQMFSTGHWAAGILGAITSVGWIVQGFGNAFYYRQVCRVSAAMPKTTEPISRFGIITLPLATPWTRQVILATRSIVALLTSWQAKAELASHGAKAYFTRG
ncbi:hypothetical protein J3R82DRAFT_5885 [Butyriboletus roseoflavus]|nr:hypothetical protein J3R82DRAFT_5885 [Butyriboletus roseoflavus]